MAQKDEDELTAPGSEQLPSPKVVPRIDPLPGGLHDLELPSTGPDDESETDSET